MRLLAVVGVAVLVAAAAGCGGYSTEAVPATGDPAGRALAAEAAAEGPVSEPPGGIWVVGRGSVSVEPDLALLELGVETRAGTVAVARADAATVMARIVAALARLGVAGTDIQTRSFNIFPLYDHYVEEIGEEGRRTEKRVLTGYRVVNLAAVKVRDLARVGDTIDAAARAGGDAIRIDGVRFTVEDTGPYLAQLRELAIADALAKAEHYAALAGVSLGGLVLLRETASPPPVPRDFAEAALNQASGAHHDSSPSPVSVGELELTLTVQTAFEIN